MKKNKYSNSRREFLKKTGLVSAALVSCSAISTLIPAGKRDDSSLLGLFGPNEVQAAPVIEDVNDKLKSTFGNRRVDLSHVTMKTPIIAENGAVVPVNIESDLPMETGDYVKKIYVFVDKNYDPFIASMDLSPANGKAALSLRIKMRMTSQVRAIMETSNGKLYGSIKTVKVTIGGCGG